VREMGRHASTPLDSLSATPKASVKRVQKGQARVDGDSTHLALELKKLEVARRSAPNFGPTTLPAFF
jgi:hypothetical protein